MKLTHIMRLQNYRALIWQDNFLYVSREYTLFRINSKEITSDKFDLIKVGHFIPSLLRRFTSKNWLLERFFRDGFHHIRMLPGSRIIGVVAKNIVILEPGKMEFKSTFKIKRGIRPNSIAVTPDGKIYWGEYFRNPRREEVNIYGSEDGYLWKIVYTFPKREIQHVHNIIYDCYENCFWVLTGDQDKESKIIKASVDWKNIDVVLEGSQQTRAAAMVINKESLFYATDTSHEQNYIYRLTRNTRKTERIFPIPGPSTFGCEVNGFLFFSTVSEPGIVSSPKAYLFGSEDGVAWQEFVSWTKDKFHPLFQYGNIILAQGSNEFNLLAVTGRAVKDNNGSLNIWKVESQVPRE